MRFLDANVFIYAAVRLRGTVPREVQKLKNAAKEIMRRIEEEDESVLTSTAHISEVANVLEEHMNLQELSAYLNSILYKDNIKVHGVDLELYRLATEGIVEHNIGLNDSLALVIMEQMGLNDIYSFDKHFDAIPGVNRVTK